MGFSEKQGKDRFSSLEQRLSQLVPSAISEEGQQTLEQTIDELAEGEATIASSQVQDLPVNVPVTGTGDSEPQESLRQHVWLKSAALLAAIVVPVALMQRSGNHGSDRVLAGPLTATTLISTAKAEKDVAEMEILTSTHRVSAHETDGLIIPADGGVPHYRYRYRVIDEEQVRDPVSGEIITLRQPRHEVITVPVTKF